MNCSLIDFEKISPEETSIIREQCDSLADYYLCDKLPPRELLEGLGKRLLEQPVCTKFFDVVEHDSFNAKNYALLLRVLLDSLAIVGGTGVRVVARMRLRGELSTREAANYLVSLLPGSYSDLSKAQANAAIIAREALEEEEEGFAKLDDDAWLDGALKEVEAEEG